MCKITLFKCWDATTKIQKYENIMANINMQCAINPYKVPFIRVYCTSHVNILHYIFIFLYFGGYILAFEEGDFTHIYI